MDTQLDQQQISSKTSWAYACTRILDTPFWGIFNMLPIILYKDLHASPVQLALIVALKPLTAIFSSYWSTWIHSHRKKIVPKIVLARLLALLPFLFPFSDSPWYFIAAFGLYMMVAYGTAPTWMELLKQNVPQFKREKLFSYTQTFGYLGGGLLPFALGGVLDSNQEAWRWLFPITVLLSLGASLFQMRILLKENAELPMQHPKYSGHLLHPWKKAWNVLKQHPDFLKYQIGFMLIGSGLMIMQPALPIYFIDTLQLSYTEMAVALTLCKGIGFACGSPLWSRLINQIDIFRFSSCITALACFFPLALILTQYQLSWLYFGYLLYGFMQSGNELAWNMSGPIFSGEKNSTTFSNINMMAIGVRGAFIPALGGLFITAWGSTAVMVLGGGLCLAATLHLFLCSRDSAVPLPEGSNQIIPYKE